jgi:hypothetical protein
MRRPGNSLAQIRAKDETPAAPIVAFHGAGDLLSAHSPVDCAQANTHATDLLMMLFTSSFHQWERWLEGHPDWFVSF